MSDQETREIIQEGEQLKQLMEKPGWRIVVSDFEKKIMDLQSIRNIDATDESQAVRDLVARNMAVDMMMEWWRGLQGKVESSDFSKEKKPNPSHIRQVTE